MPDMAKVARDDLEQHARMAVASVLDRLDLVTREEFDAQAAVLAKTRKRWKPLEGAGLGAGESTEPVSGTRSGRYTNRDCYHEFCDYPHAGAGGH